MEICTSLEYMSDLKMNVLFTGFILIKKKFTTFALLLLLNQHKIFLMKRYKKLDYIKKMIKKVLFQEANYKDFKEIYLTIHPSNNTADFKEQTINCFEQLKDFFEKNNLNDTKYVAQNLLILLLTTLSYRFLHKVT